MTFRFEAPSPASFPELGTIAGGSNAALADASTPIAIPHPLALVGATRRASGVGWIDRGDGEDGALRWLDGR
jgi:hypothetical protein